MDEDERLLSAYRCEGDVASLSCLVVRNAAWLKGLLKGLVSNAADVDDAFQETWARVIRANGAYRGGSARAYLARVARSVVIDRYRRRDANSVCLGSAEDAACAAGEPAGGGLAPDAAFESKADAEDVLRAVRDLPEGPREVFLLRVEGDLAFREIAEELNVPLGTALTWMRTATLRLRQILGGVR